MRCLPCQHDKDHLAAASAGLAQYPAQVLDLGVAAAEHSRYFGKRSCISGITQSGGWPDATRWTLA
jgi:hypothetical protein